MGREEWEMQNKREMINPSSQEAEAGELRVQGQPRPHSKTLSQKNRVMRDHLSLQENQNLLIKAMGPQNLEEV
jgi:hypothetical protein